MHAHTNEWTTERWCRASLLIFSSCHFTGSSPAAQAPTTAMIMEGLETLVTPSHHTYLLTESAAAAHFNVLSFDTCSLFKTAATTASSFNLNNNHSIANNNHHQTQLLSSHHHHHHQMQHPTTQVSHSSSSNTTASTNSSNNSSSNTSSHSTSVTHSKTDSVISSSSAAAATTTTSTLSGLQHHHHHNLHHLAHHHPTLNIHDSVQQQQTADRAQQSQTGDLNTPVTTSSDHPSFFGPSSVVEPPIITGEHKHYYFNETICYNRSIHLLSNEINCKNSSSHGGV